MFLCYNLDAANSSGCTAPITGCTVIDVKFFGQELFAVLVRTPAKFEQKTFRMQVNGFTFPRNKHAVDCKVLILQSLTDWRKFDFM